MSTLELVPKDTKQSLDLISIEQLAAYLVAVMQADFRRPDVDDMERILTAAKGQLLAIAWTAKT